MPSYLDGYAATTEGLRLSALIEREAAAWEQVPPGFELAGDCVLLRMAGLPFHVGIVVAPGHMLHIEGGLDSVCERYARPQWRQRVVGFWRWAGVTGMPRMCE